MYKKHLEKYLLKYKYTNANWILFKKWAQSIGKLKLKTSFDDCAPFLNFTYQQALSFTGSGSDFKKALSFLPEKLFR